VRVASISAFPVLIDVFPEFRDDSFFVVEDEVVIVDRSHRIVDVVPVGPRARFSSRISGGAAALDLSEPEIREIQQVLIERGFFRGRVTGVFDARTREALVSFQRRQGFRASGSIDTRTVAALGLSNKIGRNSQSATSRTQSSTVGQSRTGNTVGQGRNHANAPQNPSTVGQSRTGDTVGQGRSQANAPQKQSTVGQSRTGNTVGQGRGEANAPQKQSTTGQNRGGQQPSAEHSTTGQVAPQNRSGGQNGNQAPSGKY
jgi:peptidoglycan hydrolase-like protein with peptidoglycan-binding domain